MPKYINTPGTVLLHHKNGGRASPIVTARKVGRGCAWARSPAGEPGRLHFRDEALRHRCRGLRVHESAVRAIMADGGQAPTALHPRSPATTRSLTPMRLSTFVAAAGAVSQHAGRSRRPRDRQRGTGSKGPSIAATDARTGRRPESSTRLAEAEADASDEADSPIEDKAGGTRVTPRSTLGQGARFPRPQVRPSLRRPVDLPDPAGRHHLSGPSIPRSR